VQLSAYDDGVTRFNRASSLDTHAKGKSR